MFEIKKSEKKQTQHNKIVWWFLVFNTLRFNNIKKSIYCIYRIKNFNWNSINIIINALLEKKKLKLYYIIHK